MILSGTSSHTFLAKMRRCHPLMVYPPPNHDVGRVMASCTLRADLKGRLSINLVLVVILLPMLKIFPSMKRMFPGLLSACRWSKRLAPVRRISFKAGVRRYPIEGRCAVMCRLSLMRHDLIWSIC